MVAITLIDSSEYPCEERLDRYQEAVAHQPMPVAIQVSAQGFTSRQEIAELGPATVVRVRQHFEGTCDIRRTPRMIRRNDPEAYRLMIGLRGHNVWRADGREVELGRGDIALFDSSRPFTAVKGPRAGLDHEFVMVTLPRRHIPIPHDAVRELTARAFRRVAGPADLVSHFFTGLARDVSRYRPVDAARLATTVVDLTTLLLLSTQTGEAERTCPLGPRRLLVERAELVILQRLGDPALSPRLVAATLHVAPRTLHTAFQEQHRTVGSVIRAHRLDRCRRDLTDPDLAHRPTHAIGARWGFPSASHFCRVFEAAYGSSPHAFRRAALAPATRPGVE